MQGIVKHLAAQSFLNHDEQKFGRVESTWHIVACCSKATTGDSRCKMGGWGQLDGRKCASCCQHVFTVLSQVPSLSLGIFFALLDNLPYAVLFLPAELECLIPVVASMVMNAVLLSQIVMASKSHFFYGLAACAVEGAPFMAHLARKIRLSLLTATSGSQEHLMEVINSTVLAAFFATSLCVALLLTVLGRMRMGRLVNYLPKHVLMGTVGGVGLFLGFAGLGIAAGGIWAWDMETILNLTRHPYAWQKVATVLLLEFSIFSIATRFPELASSVVPATLMLIVAGFYATLWVLGISMETARQNGFVFDLNVPEAATSAAAAPFAFSAASLFRKIQNLLSTSFGVHQHLTWSYVDFQVIASHLPTIFAATFFVVLQPCVNIPALILQEKALPPTAADDELFTCAVGNAAGALVGAVPSYMTFSSSLFMKKCGMKYRASSFVLALLLFFIFTTGPARLLNSLPRPAAGLFALHLGATISREAFVDTAGGFDRIEYLTVFVIAAVMQRDFVWGVTCGLILAVLLFAARVARRKVVTVRPDLLHIRHHRHVRSAAQMSAIDKLLREKVAVADVDAPDLFFANAQQLANELNDVIQAAPSPPLYLIVNFARVGSVDCTAVGIIAAAVSACTEKNVTVIFTAMTRRVMARCITAVKPRRKKLPTSNESSMLFSSTGQASQFLDRSFVSLEKPSPVGTEQEGLEAGLSQDEILMVTEHEGSVKLADFGCPVRRGVHLLANSTKSIPATSLLGQDTTSILRRRYSLEQPLLEAVEVDSDTSNDPDTAQCRCITVPDLKPPGDLHSCRLRPVVRMFHSVDGAVEWCERQLQLSDVDIRAHLAASPRGELNVDSYLASLRLCLHEESAAAASRAIRSRFSFAAQLQGHVTDVSGLTNLQVPGSSPGGPPSVQSCAADFGKDNAKYNKDADIHMAVLQPGICDAFKGLNMVQSCPRLTESAATLDEDHFLGSKNPSRHFHRVQYEAGRLIWRRGSPADGMLIVSRGTFGVPDAEFERYIEKLIAEPRTPAQKDYELSQYIKSHSMRKKVQMAVAYDENAKVELHTGPFAEYFESGQMIDGLSFLAQSSRAWSLIAVTDCVAWCITTPQLRAMQQEGSEWLLVLYQSALREANLLLRSSGPARLRLTWDSNASPDFGALQAALPSAIVAGGQSTAKNTTDDKEFTLPENEHVSLSDPESLCI